MLRPAQAKSGSSHCAPRLFSSSRSIYYSKGRSASIIAAVPVFEREATTGGIVSIDGIFDRLHMLYPGPDLSLRHDEVMQLNLRADSTLAARIKAPAWEYERQRDSSNDGYKVLNIRRRPQVYLGQGRDELEPHGLYQRPVRAGSMPPEGETVLMLRLQYAEMLDLKLYYTILVSLSDKYAETER